MYVTITLGLGFIECEGYCMIYQKFIKRGLDIFFSLLNLNNWLGSYDNHCIVS